MESGRAGGPRGSECEIGLFLRRGCASPYPRFPPCWNSSAGAAQRRTQNTVLLPSFHTGSGTAAATMTSGSR